LNQKTKSLSKIKDVVLKPDGLLLFFYSKKSKQKMPPLKDKKLKPEYVPLKISKLLPLVVKQGYANCFGFLNAFSP